MWVKTLHGADLTYGLLLAVLFSGGFLGEGVLKVPLLYFLLRESVCYHRRSDVLVAAHVSWGLDSSLIAVLGAAHGGQEFCGFNGRFSWSHEPIVRPLPSFELRFGAPRTVSE